MPATPAQVSALIAAIQARADANGTDLAKIAFGDPVSGNIDSPIVVEGLTIAQEGGFSRGKGILSGEALFEYAAGIADFLVDFGLLSLPSHIFQCSNNGHAQGSAVTRYNNVHGNLVTGAGSVTEEDNKARMNRAGKVQNARLRVRANTIANATLVNFRVNGVTELTITITASTVGYFTIGTIVSYANGDDIGWQIVTGAGGGAINIMSIQIEDVPV